MMTAHHPNSGWTPASRICQHELDHLNSVFLVDLLNPAKRDIPLRRLRKTVRAK